MPNKNEELPKITAGRHTICRRKPVPKKSLGIGVTRALARLNREVVDLGLDSHEVRSILVLDGHKKVNCHGFRISGGIIHANFNLNCATKGTKTTCQISYPRGGTVPPSYRQGYLVKASDLGMEVDRSDLEKDFYLAIVNIPLRGDCDCQATYYKLVG